MFIPARPHRALIVLAKAPAAGMTKTRLCPHLTPEEAAEFAAASLVDTLAVARSVSGCTLRLAHPPGAEEALAALLGNDLPPAFAVPPGDVGVAMCYAIECALDHRATQVALIGSDLPSLPPAHIAQAFARLDDGADVVLGPAEDGGYYLIAATAPHPALFAGIAWSTGAVYAQTVAKVEASGLALATIPPWYDIDDMMDLRRCMDDLTAHPDHPATATRAFLTTMANRLNT
ncbi:MAG: TIGR04282 family arsenosugar biosynthesis glycosyltransferase [Chloroflexota bacterium]|nr:TIGR04282 family arsenosugar biosynthesis glycosyltransferase [Chloroflexota bacterium]MDQ6907109.1 TIGR04282 family arsenosugar biosynthesis glycosyltransferase [Chloroflexota bacterium]